MQADLDSQSVPAVPSEFEKVALRHRVTKISRNAKPASEILKLVLIGASGAGKTSLLLGFAEQRSVSDESTGDYGGYQTTVGVDFKMKALEIDGAHVAKVQVWDTAG